MNTFLAVSVSPPRGGRGDGDDDGDDDDDDDEMIHDAGSRREAGPCRLPTRFYTDYEQI